MPRGLDRTDGGRADLVRSPLAGVALMVIGMLVLLGEAFRPRPRPTLH